MLTPLIVIKAGGQRLPIWPAPPSTCGADLPSFCPAAYCATIKNKFIIHFHQHGEIPVDAKGTCLTVGEIHEGAQWKVIKHNDLGMFNRPQLDLVVHVLITRLLARGGVMLATVLGDHRMGQAALPTDWQNEFRAQWIDMSKPDELHNIEKQLACEGNTPLRPFATFPTFRRNVATLAMLRRTFANLQDAVALLLSPPAVRTICIIDSYCLHMAIVPIVYIVE
jgi:hypothetical protein